MIAAAHLPLGLFWFMVQERYRLELESQRNAIIAYHTGDPTRTLDEISRILHENDIDSSAQTVSKVASAQAQQAQATAISLAAPKGMVGFVERGAISQARAHHKSLQDELDAAIATGDQAQIIAAMERQRQAHREAKQQ